MNSPSSRQSSWASDWMSGEGSSVSQMDMSQSLEEDEGRHFYLRIIKEAYVKLKEILRGTG